VTRPATVSPYYIEGIKEGRAALTKHGMGIAHDELRNLDSTIRRGFDASSPVGQMLRGERDFWRNQLKRAAA
jgi:hypothetical protein